MGRAHPTGEQKIVWHPHLSPRKSFSRKHLLVPLPRHDPFSWGRVGSTRISARAGRALLPTYQADTAPFGPLHQRREPRVDRMIALRAE